MSRLRPASQGFPCPRFILENQVLQDGMHGGQGAAPQMLLLIPGLALCPLASAEFSSER